jgi:anaerobic magnesium-protoporphyrin IX monomethyl ester cyclase
MASIFLANAPYSLDDRYGKLAPVGATLPHLGVLMLGAVLREAGHTVRILDASAQGLGYEQTVKEATRFQPDIIGLTAVTPSIMKTVRLAQLLKNAFPWVPVVIGGPHFTAVPKETLVDFPVFDYGVVGEGEETFKELTETLGRGKTPSDVPGVSSRKNGEVYFSSPRPPIQDLDALPFPAWDFLDDFPDIYHPALFKYRKLPSTHVISARGCPNKCIFCDTSVFSRQIRFHSAAYVLDMIGTLANRFGIKEIIFEDDQFLIKKERVAEICEGFLKAQWGISWCCSGRVNSVNDLELLRLMKRSGCWQISYGIESGNQEILNFAKKGITIAQIQRAVALTHKAGILSKGYFILGLPHETKKSMANTIHFAKRLPLNDMSAFILTPFPGSEMYAVAEQHGTIEKNFEKMNLLDVVYVPKGLSKENLFDFQRRFMWEFYMRPKIIGNYIVRLLKNPSNLCSLLKAFQGFVAYTLGLGR